MRLATPRLIFHGSNMGLDKNIAYKTKPDCRAVELGLSGRVLSRDVEQLPPLTVQWSVRLSEGSNQIPHTHVNSDPRCYKDAANCSIRRRHTKRPGS